MKGGSHVGQARQTVERLQLGLALQRLRTKAGRSQQEAADLIGRSAPRLSQVENGKGALDSAELTRLLDFYGVQGEERATLLELGKASRRRQPRAGYVDALPNSFPRLMDLLSAARRISWYECGIIPGLVQAKSYVEAAIGANTAVRSEAAERIAFRLEMQQQVLTSTAEQINIVFTEDSLLHVVGDDSVMRRQALHLLELMEQHSTLNIRIVPMGAVNNPGNGGGLIALEFLKAEPVTFASTIYGPSTYYDQASFTEPMRQLFEQIQDLAYNVQDTRAALIDLLGAPD
ncbi:helix-turn-helix domain-containing protein [Lentzea sp. NPDC092896]|uniref:helix-turn-helix domain-containing protein n=1 Tax=Lentzea sp. NPDC092896 TaxID=3364127 RepID=UPI0037FD47F7